MTQTPGWREQQCDTCVCCKETNPVTHVKSLSPTWGWCVVAVGHGIKSKSTGKIVGPIPVQRNKRACGQWRNE